MWYTVRRSVVPIGPELEINCGRKARWCDWARVKVVVVVVVVVGVEGQQK